jgi:hypothetical protein
MGWFSRTRLPKCGHCGRTGLLARRFIRAATFEVCEGCIESAAAFIRTGGPRWRLKSEIHVFNRPTPVRCSFCNRRIEETRDRLFQAGNLIEQPAGFVDLANGAICPSCIHLCQEIFAEDSIRAPSLPTA